MGIVKVRFLHWPKLQQVGQNNNALVEVTHLACPSQGSIFGQMCSVLVFYHSFNLGEKESIKKKKKMFSCRVLAVMASFEIQGVLPLGQSGWKL